MAAVLKIRQADGTFVEVPALKGDPGKDGVSVTHSWNGTTLTITSASGTSSVDLKGEPGKDGNTPVAGTDYFTDSDKAEIVNSVIAALPVYAGEVV